MSAIACRLGKGAVDSLTKRYWFAGVRAYTWHRPLFVSLLLEHAIGRVVYLLQTTFNRYVPTLRSDGISTMHVCGFDSACRGFV